MAKLQKPALKKKKQSTGLWLAFFAGLAVGIVICPPKTIHMGCNNGHQNHYHWDDSMGDGEAEQVE